MHFYGNGCSSVDISELSRLFHLHEDNNTSFREPHKATVYFEFDKWDSRYSNVSSMLMHLINTLSWHFWKGCSKLITEELRFLNDTRAWLVEDLYHLFTVIRDFAATEELTYFIACFDQCPKGQREWFLGRVLEEQSYSDTGYRMILSTSTPGGLATDCFPEEARINLAECPAVNQSSNRLTRDLDSTLLSLITKRQIYEDFQPQIKSLLEECRNAPHLGGIILDWLGNHPRGKPKPEIADKINKLSPVTAENIVKVFISSLSLELQPKAKHIFNWIKHAAEPWSPESLTEALVVYEFRGEEPSLSDLDVGGLTNYIEVVFGGIIVVKNRDVKFSHPSFYTLPEIGIEGTAEEWPARVNSTIAETCLRYFQLRVAQDMMEEFCLDNLEGGPWTEPVDAVVVSHLRTSMAEYAVRFWSQHYKASGRFKPSELVHALFTNKESRAAWEVPFWLLSNPFTRIQRSYISMLPALAMLGLDDLIEECVNSEKGQPSFEKDCWFAITEAARAGNKEIVERLLELPAVNDEELRSALFWAAANGNPAVVDAIVEKIPSLETFEWPQWPEHILFRAAAAGLNDLLKTMLRSGCNINMISNYWKAPPGVIIAWRDHVSTMKILLNSEPKPDLTVRDMYGDTSITTAIRKGIPRMIELLL
jgi:hypothetical protein